ncbi:MAG: pyridoxal-phosphate dependent enzyme, partial [Leptotrichiaceae bacterium]
VYDGNIVDEIIQISNEKSFEFGNRMSKEEGLFLGISSGAAIAAAYEVAKRLGKGKTVLTISPDGGEKYLSTDMFK